MGKLDEIYNTKELVVLLLENEPECRNSDDLLYVKVCEHKNPRILKMPFWEVMIHSHKYHLPAYETVRRTRQRLQEERPDLGPTAFIKGHRQENEEAFEKFARKYS